MLTEEDEIETGKESSSIDDFCQELRKIREQESFGENDADLDEISRRQLNNMLSFIEQEASEKVSEIEARTEEDYHLEKGKLVQRERMKILQYYEKAEKRAVVRQKRETSNLHNVARLKVLTERDKLVCETIEAARIYLQYIANPKNELYRSLIHLLIDEGILMLNEPHVIITAREIDKQLVHSMFNRASQNYEEKTGDICILRLDQKNTLSNDSNGGIFLRDPTNRIKIDNTLNSRFNLIVNKLMPTVRQLLFEETARKWDF